MLDFEKNIDSSMEDFFLNKKIITEKQALDATRYRKEREKFLGNYAIDMKFLSLEEVEEILKKQKYEEKYFGEIAIEMNKLSKNQVDFLLNLQYENTLHFGEVIARLGYISRERMLDELSNFVKKREFVSVRYKERGISFIKKFRETLINSASIFNYENVVKKFILNQTQQIIDQLPPDTNNLLNIKVHKDRDKSGYFLTLKAWGRIHSILLSEDILLGSFSGEIYAIDNMEMKVKNLIKQVMSSKHGA